MKIALCGEAPGRQEEIYRRPFVGAAGNELNRLLIDAGIMTGRTGNDFRERESKVYLTNVFSFRPPADDNNVLSLCCKKTELPDKGKGYPMPSLTQSKYVKPEYLGELDRLRSELEEQKPNIVLACGNTALWALTKRTGITKWRGTTIESTLIPGLKVLPTYHPAALFREADRRPTVVLDLIKAKEELERPAIARRHREIWLEPTIADLLVFADKYLANSAEISFDIENPNEIIACVGLAPDPDHAIVVPFEDKTKPAHSYWPTREEELFAWCWLKHWLESPIPKVAQNGAYDIGHLSAAGINVRNFRHDTMLLHHALQPEERKSLGYLASIYTDESAFKELGARGKKSIKRDQ